MGSSSSQRSVFRNASLAEAMDHDAYAVQDGGKYHIYAWLPPAVFIMLQSADGTATLHEWLTSLRIDDMIDLETGRLKVQRSSLVSLNV